MISKFTLFCNLLLASAALAVPSSQLWDRLGSRRENPRSEPIHNVSLLASPVSDATYTDSNWAGAVVTGNGGYNSVVGIFQAPAPFIFSDGTVSIGVGIGGRSCSTSIVQAGIFLNATNGNPSYSAWSRWTPQGYNIEPFPITAGDTIQVSINMQDPLHGHAYVQDTSYNQIASWNLVSSDALCQADVEWFAQPLQGVPLAVFQHVVFGYAYAHDDSDVIHRPSEGDTYNMSSPTGGVLMSAYVGDDQDSVIIAYT